MPIRFSTEQIATAIYVLNKHAKRGANNLYSLKHKALKKLIKEERAFKIALQYSLNPCSSKPGSVILVQIPCELVIFYFHMSATPDDLKNLPHIGHIDPKHRNPKRKMPLLYAKNIVSSYLGIAENPTSTYRKKQKNKNIFISTYLDG